MKETVLMVAEKPLLARWIAYILSGGRMRTQKGWNGACSIHEYDGMFLGRAVTFKMTSTLGHVMGLDFDPRYNNWYRTDPEELFDAEIEKKEANPRTKMLEYLASVAEGCDYLVLWLDCDKEGENICFEVIDAVVDKMKPRKPGGADPIYRARFSAITAKDINQAMRSLGRPNENESLSVDARQEIDLRIGCAFTRFQTMRFKRSFPHLSNSCISFGPCQTPTLGFCVSRHDEIENFIPETYWQLQVALACGEWGGKIQLKPQWDGGRISDRKVGQLLADRLSKRLEAVVVDINKKVCVKQKPVGLNTVELIRVCSSRFGMEPRDCMNVAQFLYTRGYMSYGRTESTAYSENFDFDEVLDYLIKNEGNASWSKEARALKARGLSVPMAGHDAGDHPPITPMMLDPTMARYRSRNTGELSEKSAQIYDYICRHFLATISEACKYILTTACLEIGEERFTLTGKKVIEPGYTKFMPWEAIEESTNLQALEKNRRLKIVDVKLVKKQTERQNYLTEAELITLMDEHRIGTDGSIPVHINTIYKREYVKVKGPQRRVVPTALGIVLIHGYKQTDPDLVQPEMRAAVEKELNEIAVGINDYETVVDRVLETFREKFTNFVRSFHGIEELLEVSLASEPSHGQDTESSDDDTSSSSVESVRPSTKPKPPTGHHAPAISVERKLDTPPPSPPKSAWSSAERTFPASSLNATPAAAPPVNQKRIGATQGSVFSGQGATYENSTSGVRSVHDDNIIKDRLGGIGSRASIGNENRSSAPVRSPLVLPPPRPAQSQYTGQSQIYGRPSQAVGGPGRQRNLVITAPTKQTKKRKFVADGVFKAELNNFLMRELAEDGYSGVEVRKTPTRTEAIIIASGTHTVLGEQGRRIRELTSLVQKRFGFKEGTVELYVEKVPNRGLCAIAQCESLRYKLIGGLAVRRACYGVLRFIMESQAMGCEVIVSGKLRGQRAKAMKFVDGLVVHSGEATNEYLQKAVRHVQLRQGVLGIKVKIMLPHDPKGASGPKAPLPDDVQIMEPKHEQPNHHHKHTRT